MSRKLKKDNDAMGLEKFMARAGPVMEQVIEENSKLRLALDKEKSGAKPPKVEQKQSLHFPQDLLFMLGTPDEKAEVLAISSMHLFETAPQSKCAIAYEIMSPREDLGMVYLIIVYSITANQVLRILKSESLVTQMCTPADD